MGTPYKCKKSPGCGCQGDCKEMLEPIIVTAPAKPKLAVRTLEIAISKVGVREIGGDNRGPDVEMFQRAAKIAPGQPWCMAFINWCAEQAAKELGVVSPLEALSLQGFVQAHVDYFKPRGKVLDKSADARPGDLAVFWYASLKRYGHVGIVERVEPGVRIFTVEGNTNAAGGREGNAVARKERPTGSNVKYIRWVG
jgi:hypothetical protein